jgi:hypothetical protein
MAKNIVISLAITLPALLAIFLWLVFFSARPPLTTDAATLAGDGSTLDYCRLPQLGGTGKQSHEIAKGNTPGCGYDHFPLPILADCTEPLPPEADDIRGLWLGVAGGHIGHVERIEQCGVRTVITTAGIIHDYGPNSTGGLNTDDTEGGVTFTIGDKAYCPRSSAAMIWHDKVLHFHALGWGPVVVRRYLDGDQLIWEYADGTITRMDRICQLPPEHKTPRPRGAQFKLF